MARHQTSDIRPLLLHTDVQRTDNTKRLILSVTYAVQYEFVLMYSESGRADVHV